MSQREDWITYPGTPEMNVAAEELGNRLNKIWAYGPASERILTEKWGENHIVGARGHWTVKQELAKWGMLPLETPIFANKGDTYDFLLPRVGYTDVKTKQLHSSRIKEPDRVEVNISQKGKPDIYIFCCWHSWNRVMWILGWMPYSDYWNGGALWRKGEIHEGRKVKASMLVRPIVDLRAMNLLRTELIQKHKTTIGRQKGNAYLRR